MVTYIVFDEKKYEVLDQQAVFMEGEKMLVVIGEARKPYTVASVTKVLRETGGKFDVSTEVVLM